MKLFLNNLENNLKSWLFMSYHHREKENSLLGYATYSEAFDSVPKSRMGQEQNGVIRS